MTIVITAWSVMFQQYHKFISLTEQGIRKVEWISTETTALLENFRKWCRSWKPSKMMVANQWDMDSQIEAEELKALTKAILTNSPSMANSIAADEIEKNNNREV
ncbi:hypothetical protein Droror1_Dr00014998 [Drosera rotundifolia]